MLVGLFTSTLTKEKKGRVFPGKTIPIGSIVKEFKMDSVAFYIRLNEDLQAKGELLTKRRLYVVDTEELKQRITPFVEYIKPIYFKADKEERRRMNMLLNFRDIVYMLYGGYPDSDSLVKWILENFSLDLGCGS